MKMSEFFSQKIDLANGLLAAYKETEEALTDLIENPVQTEDTRQQKLQTSKYKIERFEIQAAIVSQQFNLDELIRKHDEYNAKIEVLRERMAIEWEPTLLKIKRKMQKRSDSKIAVHDLAQAISRSEEPFSSEEEKIEWFQSLLDLSAD